MNNTSDNAGYKKLLKSTGIFIAMFVAMCWVLTKTEEHDKQVQSQIAVTTPVQVAPTPVSEPAKPKTIVYRYTPKELQDAFDVNEVRITHKLNGNLLVLNGKISGIGLSFNKPVIDISVPNSYDTIKVFFDSGAVDMVSKFNVGDFVRVASRDVSLNPFGTIHLRSSSVLSDTNNKQPSHVW